MKKIISLILALVLIASMLVSCKENDTTDIKIPIDGNEEEATISEKPTNFVLIDVKDYGKIVVELYPDVAPITVENFKNLVSEKFYDGLIFHRIIEGFMIQGGGYTENYQEKDAPSIKGEFASNGIENNLLHTRGVISMARTNVKDSASSQFFIMHQVSPWLDGDYAAFGMVIEGIEVVDKIAAVQTNYYDEPVNNVVINSIRFLDIKK